MVKPIIDFARQLLTITRDVREAQSGIRELREEVKEIRAEVAQLRSDFKDLTHAVEMLAFRVQADREAARKDFENLILRLNNALLEHDPKQRSIE